MTLQEFLNSQEQNAWVTYREMNVYVRKAIHAIPGRTPGTHTMAMTFDIANIENEEKERGRGDFWSLLSTLSRDLDKSVYEAIYLENVVNQQLKLSLMKRGYPFIPTQWLDSPSFYILLNE